MYKYLFIFIYIYIDIHVMDIIRSCFHCDLHNAMMLSLNTFNLSQKVIITALSCSFNGVFTHWMFYV